jgi:hypothetical protein
MIPYEELVAALTSWRERQGLPVRREDLFDVDPSLAPMGVAEALATPLLTAPSSELEAAEAQGAYADYGEATRLETADVVDVDEAAALVGLGSDEEEETFIGSSPTWSGGEAPAPQPADWEAAAGDDATGESLMAPPSADDTLGDEIDAALAEGDPTPGVPPQDPTAGDDDAYVVAETAMEPPAAAQTDADEPWPIEADPASPWESEEGAAAGDAWPAPEAGGAEDDGEQAFAVDDQAILDELDAALGHDQAPAFQEAATAIRDQGESGGFDLPAGDDQGAADFDVDAADVLDAQDMPEGSGPDDEDPFRP